MFFFGGKDAVGRLLLVSGDEIYSHRMMKRAEDFGFKLEVTSKVSGLGRRNLAKFDIVVLNFDGEEGVTGIEVAEFLYRKHPLLGVIFVSGLTGVWQDPSRRTPNVLGTVSQWNGVDTLFRMALKHFNTAAFESVSSQSQVPELTLSQHTRHVTQYSQFPSRIS